MDTVKSQLDMSKRLWAQEMSPSMGCRLCQNPTFHEDIILDGYLEKWMWTFAK